MSHSRHPLLDSLRRLRDALASFPPIQTRAATFQEAYEKAAPPTYPSTGLFARYRIWAPHSGPFPR